MCEMLLAYLIIGAVETTPGWMRVEQIRYTDGLHTETRVIHIPTQEYLECWDGQAGATGQNT